MHHPYLSLPEGTNLHQHKIEALVGKKLATQEAVDFILFMYEGRIEFLLETASYRQVAKKLRISFIEHIYNLLCNNCLKPSEILFLCLLKEDMEQLYVAIHDDAERFTGVYESLIDRLTASATTFNQLEFIWKYLNTAHPQSEKFAEKILSNGVYLINEDRDLDIVDEIARFSGGEAMVKLTRLIVSREINRYLHTEH